ncbi:MAG: hypothetical protein IPJ77_14390 [Planctomycetes bacterium]|nr:hypothetical protein [Planctomycetota bacterium]
MNPRARLRPRRTHLAATASTAVAACVSAVLATGALSSPTQAPRAASVVASETGSALHRDERSTSPLRAARERFDAKDYAATRELLTAHLRRTRGEAAAHDLLAQALEKLGELDEAGWRYAVAARAYAAEGQSGPARAALAGERRCDPLAARREAFERKLVQDLASGAEELLAQGHTSRALQLAERIAPLARDKDAERVRNVAEKARASSREVDLEQESRERAPGAAWPLVERESRHYRLACHLEPELVERLGAVLDDLHAYYVAIYFDGDAKKARAEKATIRILPDRARMLELWRGGGNGPEGWWSPGTNEVITYDVRSRKGRLDEMLETLFHEASHQFMTLASGGGYVPAWLNEGTACFFEGTRAMADHRVLWPDAAIGRLATLVPALRSGRAPTALDVVAYSSPASYPAEYYAFGWGLVYFLQEYEDERTFEHVYRPLYARYKSAIVQRGGDPMKVFEEVFLGPDSPLGHATFAEFERDWSRWITERVWPLFGDDETARARRLERVTRYVAAAEAARGKKQALVGEKELVERALGHVEYVRTRIDGESAPDGELLLRQAALLERLERPAAAAPLVEQALDLADQGRFALEPARYAELEKLLARLDRRNAALRSVRSRTAGLVRAARALLADLAKDGDASVLRAMTFASSAGAALEDETGLLASARELRERARALGRLHGAVRPLESPATRWKTIFNAPPTRFDVEPGRASLECVRSHALVDPGVELSGEYEVRGRLVRAGAPDFGFAAALVVCARDDADWTAFGIDERGHAGQWVVERSAKNGVATNRPSTWTLDPPVAPDEEPELVVRVLADGRVSFRVGDRAPIESRLAVAPGLARRAGVFAKNGRVVFADLVAEPFP